MVKYTITIDSDQGKVSFVITDEDPGQGKTVKIAGETMSILISTKPEGEGDHDHD